MKIAFGKIVFVALVVFSALFYYAYYTLHYKWRDCFNALGRCYYNESGVVYLAQSGAVWLILAVLASVLTLYQLFRLMR